jgi:hypothetical protein
MTSNASLKRNVAIAVVGGSLVGAAAGLASHPRREVAAPEAQSAVVIVEPVAAPAQDAQSRTAPAQSASAKPAPAHVAPPQSAPALRPPVTEPRPPASDASGSAVARARDLAQRGDVASLLALREEILQRSQKSGQSESPAAQREIEEVDRYITEARMRRLKIDGEALQKSTEP